MAQWSYFRDVWGLGPPNTGYAGSFPRGLLNRMKKKGWWGKNRLWLFSGVHKDPDGTTVDIKPELNPDVCCNCEKLPFEDESFDFVMLDPPYSEKEAKELYNLPYFNILKVINEAARVCKPNGCVALLHRLITWHHPEETVHKKRLKIEALVGIFTIAGYTNIRALSVWRKHETIANWQEKT